ncbi:hypothetical protein SERLA73DRAFT_183560 [Serpula lacrymans var. lacrymans S7.3]|uniref:C3H1-type domain-containing protein n=2 Tax=Serpula lacrymans var. lacrymans TaxID=341189 RepID=F8Q036_SERL3|nr:uncharacterized protein SERLADRAFT_470798 [Serpula lacrymans var. lacrymans S7.9]EGN98508.1 hypothetical protein SERLA73DRAFT_183560 [Serpula lacrymans var. lacrymans S7.3]EGO24082.1 hypothetical protein SERLADRAFT_470798 [Serpula lacrymans var. lacrymans S7.9]
MAQTETEGNKRKHKVSMHNEQAETSVAGQSGNIPSAAPDSITSPKQSFHHSTICRYHQAGYCRHGDFCHFRHAPNNFSENHHEYRKDPYTSVGLSPLSLYAPSRSSFTPYHISPSWISFPPPYSGFANQNLTRAICSPALNSPIPDVYTFSDASSSGTDEVTSISPKTSRRSYHPRDHDRSYSQAPTALSPNIYFPLHFAVPEPTPSYRNTSFIERRQIPAFRKKPVPYKTKICKFYKKNGSCPNGDKCTFIHNVTSHPKGAKNDKNSTPATTPKARQDGTDPDATLVDRDVPVDLPTKPMSLYEQYRKQGYYPVTWRVIGGGVMMGGKREPCKAYTAGHCKDGDDCRFAHEIDGLKNSGPPSLPDPPELDRSSRRKMVIGRTREPHLLNGTLDIYIPPQPLPARGPTVPPVSTGSLGRSNDGTNRLASGKHEDESHSDTALSRRRRSRSMSTPSSPLLPRVSTHNLFPAEL